MNYIDAVNFVKQFGECPKCGNVFVGNGQGTIDIDTEKGYFKRTCSCGWSVVVEDGKGEGE